MSPSKFRLRRVFSGIVVRVAKPLVSLGVKPDTITYFTLLLSLCAILVLKLSQSQIGYGLLVFFIGFFDGVDGAVARLSSKASEKGAFIDSVVDKVSEVLVLLGVLLTYPDVSVLDISVPMWILICVSSWLMTSYTRARAESLGVEDLDVGFGGRSERLFILFLFSIFTQLLWGLIVVTIIGVTTAAFRIHYYVRQLSGPSNSETHQQT